MSKMKLTGALCSTLICAGLFAAPIASAQSMKVGVIIPQRLLAESRVGKAAAEKLKARKDEAQRQLDRKAEEIKAMQEDLKRRAMVLSGEEKRKAAEKFDLEQREAKRMKEDLERDLGRLENEILGEVNEKLTKTIVDFGKNNGYDIILDASATVYFAIEHDITAQVVELADSTR